MVNGEASVDLGEDATDGDGLRNCTAEGLGSSIKTHIKRVGSPKFEKLQNDTSPTATKEETDVRSVDYENKGFEANDMAQS